MTYPQLRGAYAHVSWPTPAKPYTLDLPAATTWRQKRPPHVWVERATVLVVAVIYKLAAVVQDQLQKQPTVVWCRGANGATSLMLAAVSGCLNVVQLLVSNILTEVNFQDTRGRIALRYAITQKKYPIVRQIFNSTGDLDIGIGASFAHLCEKYHTREPKEARIFSGSFWLEQIWRLTATVAILMVTHLGSSLLNISTLISSKISSTKPSWRLRQLPQKHRLDISFGTIQDMCGIPAIIQLLANDPHFNFKEFYALELLWPFMGMWDDEQQPWKYMLRDLLESRHISFETRDSKRRGLLHHLSNVGEDEYKQGHLEFLLQRLAADLTDEQERTPLHVAAQNGYGDLLMKMPCHYCITPRKAAALIC
ncbi:uncharacterized protein BDR25DRAFT_362315 [Lindgomyces ingoldianus]|uniref:Uncharacterized protein n=1 Tax=Lindgomyces ingoldianus TaxID=673940 RepID=A0ACB6QAD1_9PLEO|nr:uncharacterized protein BDR25DRAFT_362315 [Lindgomyces ingoldianus]KAF2463884.1 hypothetical protein BDR25DRAFT_362315 [Lindgomyces ingoldianus]